MADPFKKAKVILHELLGEGHSAYIVGGSVRDFLQGAPIHDIDIATSATPEQVMMVFPVTFPVGIQHGTVIVRYENENYDGSTFRTEQAYSDFRHPDQVQFVGTIEEDLARRDFTINAMAMDINGSIIDPYHGQNDLKKRLLKTVGVASERFKEDPLRMLRAVRFVAQLDLMVDPELEKAITETAPLIEKLAVERIREECTKMLSGKALTRGIHLLVKTGLIHHLPLFNQVNLNIQADFGLLETDAERWAMFLIQTGCEEPEVFLKAWRFSNKAKNQINTLILGFNELKVRQWDRNTIFRYGIAATLAVERLKMASRLSYVRFQDVHAIWDELPIKDRSELAVNGADLCSWTGKKGGPWTGQMIDEMVKNIIEGKIKNDKDIIKRWVAECQQNKKF